MQYSIVGTENDGSNITVFLPGEKPQSAHSSHPNYASIVEKALAGDESVVELFDVAATVASKFERLSDRVTVAHGRLFFDADEVDNALATQVIRFMDEGVTDYKPLVNFFEKVQTNDNEHSREQLYTWLETESFTITDDGMIVGYKGVQPEGEDFLSINSGRAIVNGEVKNGRIKQSIGDVVEMPRSEVEFDPATGCSTGLHVGTWGYASGFARGAVLEVHVNPRDVISVPTDCHCQKMRVCRYTIAGVTEVAYTEPVIFGDDYEYEDDLWGDDEDEEYDSFWGEREYEDFDDEVDPELTEGAMTGYFVSPAEQAVESVIYGGDPGDEHQERNPVSQSYPLGQSVTQETEDGQTVISVGDKFADRDARRAGNVFTVESVDEDSGIAVGKWSPSGLTRSIAFDRLLSRKYDRA